MSQTPQAVLISDPERNLSPGELKLPGYDPIHEIGRSPDFTHHIQWVNTGQPSTAQVPMGLPSSGTLNPGKD